MSGVPFAFQSSVSVIAMFREDHSATDTCRAKSFRGAETDSLSAKDENPKPKGDLLMARHKGRGKKRKGGRRGKR